MKNPNGYGSVMKLGGSRRKPWTARVTIGFNQPKIGSQIRKYIGFYATRAEAMRALALYNGEAVEDEKITLGEVYEEWAKEHAPTVKNFRIYSSAFKIFEPLTKKPIEKLTIRDFEDIGGKSGKSKVVLNNAKIALAGVYGYGYRKGYIDESKATMPSFIKFVGAVENKAKRQHKAFTREEIAVLWDHKDDPIVQIILFMIYTGVRSGECFDLKRENVHVSDRYFDVVKAKTEAGIRSVPIADKIMPIVEAWDKREGVYFVPVHDYSKTLDHFQRYTFQDKCKDLGLDHLSHDPRHTASTLMAEAGIDDRLMKRILGHKFHDVTNAVYAKKLSNEVLLKAINQI